MTYFCLRFRGTAPPAGDAGHGGNDGLPHKPLGSTIGSRFKSSPQRRRKIATVRGLVHREVSPLLPRVVPGCSKRMV